MQNGRLKFKHAANFLQHEVVHIPNVADEHIANTRQAFVVFSPLVWPWWFCMFSFFLVLQSFMGFLTSWLRLCSPVHRNHSRERKEITNTANTQTKTTTSTVVGLFLQLHHHHQQQQQGNRLTRRSGKGDKFEIEIFEAKRQNAGICGTCQKVYATWTFISIGRCVTQFKKMHFECVANQLWSSSAEKTLGIYDFQVSHANIHQIIHPFSWSVPKCFRQSHGHRLKRGDIMTPCPAVSPRVFFLYAAGFSCAAWTLVSIFSVGPVLHSSRTWSHPPTPTPLLTIREHVQHVNNGSRGPCVIFVQTLSHPPTPNPLVDHKRACATSATS